MQFLREKRVKKVRAEDKAKVQAKTKAKEVEVFVIDDSESDNATPSGRVVGNAKRMKLAKEDGDHGDQKMSKVEVDGSKISADVDGGLKDGSEYWMDELIRELSRNLGKDKLAEISRILNMNSKGADLDALHSRAQGDSRVHQHRDGGGGRGRSLIHANRQ